MATMAAAMQAVITMQAVRVARNMMRLGLSTCFTLRLPLILASTNVVLPALANIDVSLHTMRAGPQVAYLQCESIY